MDAAHLWATEDEGAATSAAPRVVGPASALRAAQEIDDSSHRRDATPVRKSFVVGTEAPPPLARLLQVGGRGGAVAIKLYLAVLWRCSSEPFQTQKPYRGWATLLGLDSPETKGARRIGDAVKTLVDHRLVTVKPSPGALTVIALLDESGDGSDYVLPSTEYVLGPGHLKQRNLYLKVPSRLWTEGHLQMLSGAGLALLLILLAEQGGDRRVWFSTEVFPRRYWISHNTRAAGTKELRERGLLVVERHPLQDRPGQESVFERRRRRNVYVLQGAAAADKPARTAAGQRSLTSSAKGVAMQSRRKAPVRRRRGGGSGTPS